MNTVSEYTSDVEFASWLGMAKLLNGGNMWLYALGLLPMGVGARNTLQTKVGIVRSVICM